MGGMRGSRKFCQRGSNFDNVFFSIVDEGREAFRWRADNGPKLNAGLVAAIFQGIRTYIARNPIFL